MAKCRSCDAEIEWGLLNGRHHPLDIEPNPAGNLVETPIIEQGGRVVRTITKANPAPSDGVIRMSHFASCPNREQHRRRR